MRANTSAMTGSLWFAERPAPADPFASPRQVAELTAGPVESNPSLTADERMIHFASDRDGDLDLYFATRPDRTTSFGPPRLVPGLNGSAEESEGFIRDDGCEVFFSSLRDGTLGFTDLYRAVVISP